MSTDVTNVRHVRAALGVLALLPYLNAVGAGWTFDDLPTVRDNPAVVNGVDPIGALTVSFFGVSYRPLTLLSYAINYRLAAGVPAAFHAANVALHVMVTLLVFTLAVRLFRDGEVLRP